MFRGRVLVVDDEEVVRASCKKILAPEGYEVHEAESPEKAIEKIQAQDYDVVVTDLKMPQMDGVQLLRYIKEQSPTTEVLIVTGYATVASAVEAMKYGAYDYIEKPFRVEELRGLVQRAVERRRLRQENIKLREALSDKYIKNIVGASKAMKGVFALVNRIAPTSSTVLVLGESGTGKELIARAIHYNSPRAEGPFVVVDCTSLPKELMESELFGHTKGAFTGALSDKKGLIEEAQGGTLFLDEIGELPLELQGKLLRVLQSKELRPVGGQKSRVVDVRFIAATNRDLEALVQEGRFREDLYWRLNVFPIKIPPLRQRKEDIPVLVQHFIEKYSAEVGRGPFRVTAEAMKLLMEHDWPGNVRELENTIHRAMLLSTNGTITEKEIGLAGPEPDRRVPRTAEELKQAKRALRKLAEEELERAFVLQALEEADWNVSRAAKMVGMQRPNFHALMRKYGIKKGGR